MTPRERAVNYSHSLIIKARLNKSDELIDDIEKMITHAVEEEREACALICEEYTESYRAITERAGGSAACYAVTASSQCASSIRNRKGID